MMPRRYSTSSESRRFTRRPALVVLFAAACGATSEAQTVTPVPLEYNFNGIVHAGEAGLPDELNGFRSISDRALDFSGGVPNDPLLDDYTLESAAGVLDLVHLGNREKVAGGAHAFDLVANNDNEGIQPAWLTNVDQTGPQISTLTTPLQIPLNQSTTAGVLFHISNGGGGFDVVFGFASGAELMTTVTGPDWFGGNFQGTGSVDKALPDGNLNITEVTTDLSFFAGDSLTSIRFENADNPNGGVAVFAANLVSAATASNTLRNAGTNPISYITGTRPVLGSTYVGTVALMSTTGHDLALLVGSASPAEFTLPGGQTVLIDPLDPSGELLGLSPDSGPTAVFSFQIPADPALAGMTLSTQAVHAGGAPSFALSNAYDHVLGI